MSEDVSLPNMPGYVSIKEAAKILNISANRVYTYVEDGRLSGVKAAHVIMIPLEEVKNFKPNISGRPRISIPKWRISPTDNTLLRTSIRVHVRAGQQARLFEQFEAIRQSDQLLFPGTVIRYVAGKEKAPQSIEIVLIWRSSVMPDEAERERELEAFRQVLADVVDWDTAQYEDDVVYMHT